MLYVVRHGHTDWNNKKISMGKKDIPLNDDGIKEAYITSSKLEDISFDLIICSPLERAKKTASIINEKRNTNIIYDSRIEERGLGLLEGKPYSSDNDILWDIKENTNKYSVEKVLDFKNRVYSFLDEVKDKYKNKDILLVTHGGVSALINTYFNNSLYDGSLSNKFLKNCEYAIYNFEGDNND